MGPTLAGFTVEYYGFQATTLGFVIGYISVLLIDFVELSYTIRSSRYGDYDEIEETYSLQSK